ncbi:MAG: hypothetical protein ACOYK6_06275 [Chthoniobacterales bacterium]
MKEVFFYVPEQFIFNYDQNPGKIFSKIGYSVFYNWIHQTWSLLQEANIACKLTSNIQEKGILIIVGGFLDISFEVNQLPSASTFLVEVVADGFPSPRSHYSLLQNRAHAALLPHACFMPHWPQPGLIPRDSARGVSFKNICFFGEVENLAPELRSPAWSQRLEEELGLHFEIRTVPEWHDYRDVDCAIGIRDFSFSHHFHKPATKLYNAWLAGVPFIGGSDSAYQADGHPGRDYLLARSLEEIFQYLKRLQENCSFRSMLVQNGYDAGKSFTTEATLKRWKKLIEETLPSLALASSSSK